MEIAKQVYTPWDEVEDPLGYDENINIRLKTKWGTYWVICKETISPNKSISTLILDKGNKLVDVGKSCKYMDRMLRKSEYDFAYIDYTPDSDPCFSELSYA